MSKHYFNIDRLRYWVEKIALELSPTQNLVDGLIFIDDLSAGILGFRAEHLSQINILSELMEIKNNIPNDAEIEKTLNAVKKEQIECLSLINQINLGQKNCILSLREYEGFILNPEIAPNGWNTNIDVIKSNINSFALFNITIKNAKKAIIQCKENNIDPFLIISVS